MTETTRVAQLDDIEGYSDEGRPTWRPIRTALGVHAFGINAWEATEPGQQLIGEHDEVGAGAGGHEEVYVVTSGRARFTVDGRPIRPRRARSSSSGPGEHALGHGRGAGHGRPGRGRQARRGVQRLAVGALGRGAPLLEDPGVGAGDRGARRPARRAAGQRRDALQPRLRRGTGRSGRGAIVHLQRAVELDPRFRDHAQTDPDLESLRGDARFPRTAA